MKFMSKITELVEQRVKKYGAQYYTFATFGIINYPLTIIYEIQAGLSTEGIWLRLLATLLCFILLFKNKWPSSLQRFLPLHWYITLTISLPVIATFLLLENDFSLGWLMNFNIGAMILILLIDSISFVIIEIIGILIGLTLFLLQGNSIPNLPNYQNASLFAYIFICIIVIASIFSRNREIFNDFTQKTKDDLNSYLEQKIKERTKELEEALASKTEFLNNISHEIRTPIQGFTSFAEGLVDHWDEFNDEKKLKLSMQVSNNARRLANLMNNLLDLSKFTAKKMILDFQEVDLVLSINEIIDETNSLYLNGKKIKIKFKNKAKISLVEIDKFRIEQVLRNLFANAIRFSHDNSTITVLLRNVKEIDGSSILYFSLADEGIGVPEEELESIFDSFTQSSRTKTAAGGTGLGLSICKQITEAHQGKIWATNNVNRGTILHLILPIKQNRLIKKTKDELVDTKSNIGLVPINILMIDDEETCLDSMEMLLMNSPYFLIKFSNPIEGLKYLKVHFESINILLLDLMMPEMYGLTLLKELKLDPNTAKIRVILQTGTSDQDEISRAFQLGVTSYLKKPYDKPKVLYELNKIMSAEMARR